MMLLTSLIALPLADENIFLARGVALQHVKRTATGNLLCHAHEVIGYA